MTPVERKIFAHAIGAVIFIVVSVVAFAFRQALLGNLVLK